MFLSWSNRVRCIVPRILLDAYPGTNRADRLYRLSANE